MPTILDPQGVAREIPADQIDAAIAAGGKPASRVQAPGGTIHWIPNESLGDAEKAGGMLVPEITAPAVDMKQDTGGALFGGPTGTAPDETLPSPKAQMAKDTKPSTAVGAVTLGAGAALAAAPAVEAAPAIFKALASAAEAHPIIAKLLLKGLEGAGLTAGGVGVAKLTHLVK